MNQSKETTAFLHNGNGSETTLQALLTGQQVAPEKAGDYDLSMEARLAFIERGIKNGVVGGGGDDGYTKWDQINMNVTKLPTDNMMQLDEAARTGAGDNNNDGERFFNGNRRSQGPRVAAASAGMTACSGGGGDPSLSRSTEELSPEKRAGRPLQVAKCHSVSNMEAGGGMRLFAFDGDHPDHPYGGGSVVGVGAGPQPPIVRSKSASQLLSEQSLQVCAGSSASSSDLLSSATKPPARYPAPSAVSPGVPPPPQYNIQYTSAALPKDGYWAHRVAAAPPTEHQSYLPPPPPHSLANTNYSNRNQAPPAYPLHAPNQPWGTQPRSSTLQRQSSAASNASTSDYLTYRDIHTLARGPLAMSHAAHRPLSARTYSMDAPSGGGRPHVGATRLQPHEVPERTMSVSDFNYQHGSPSKRPNARVKSEHSLLDGPGLVAGGGGRVPADWRDQVMRHIEAKKMEKVN